MRSTVLTASFAIFATCLVAVACGSSSSNSNNNASNPNQASNSNTQVLVTVNGVVAPFNPNETANPNFAGITVSIYDPGVLLKNPNATALGTTALDATKCAATGCPFTVTGVNIASVELGLVAEVTSPAAEWVVTYSGIATSAQVAASLTSRAAITATPALLLSALDYQGIAAVTQQDPSALLAKGVMLGIVLGKASEATAATGGVPPAIAGATAAIANVTAETIVYPAADFQSTSTSTSTTGIFIAYPTTATSVVGSWTMTPPSSDTTHTYSPLIAGSNPGAILIVEFEANP